MNIDRHNKIMFRQRAETRRQQDVMAGRTRATTAQRGDFKICREEDKLLDSYRRHKNPADRKKITGEIDQMKKEEREYKGG